MLRSKGPQALKSTRALKFVALASWATVFFTLALVQIAAPSGTANSDTGGRTAGFVLATVAVIPSFVHALRLRTPRWLPIAVGFIGFMLPTGLWLLVHTGRDSLAWSAYGGLQVLRARWEFNDLYIVLRWIDCGGCRDFDANYGPGLPWLHGVFPGVSFAQFSVIFGLGLNVILSIAIGWLAFKSRALGAGFLLLIVFGGAWILLLDRGNLDSLVLLVPIFGMWLLGKRNSYTVWVVFAIIIFILGTWKFYPFALGIMLLPALRLRRGWAILAAFIAVSGAFMLLNWQAFRQSSAFYDTLVIVYDFPALGRAAIESRLFNSGSLLPNQTAATMIVGLMCVSFFAWGWLVSRRVPVIQSWLPGMVAVSGATIFLSTILVSGFGFQYKAAFLLLGAPLLGLMAMIKDRATLYTAIVAATLSTIACVIGYSILLTSLAGLSAASLLLGAGLRPLLMYAISRNPKAG